MRELEEVVVYSFRLVIEEERDRLLSKSSWEEEAYRMGGEVLDPA